MIDSMPDVLVALGPFAALGIAVGSSLLSGLAGQKQGQAKSSPAFDALAEIRRRRMQELQDIQKFTSQLVDQRMSEPGLEMNREQSAVDRLRKLLSRQGG